MEKSYEERISICKACGLCKKTWDGSIRCDSTKYISPDGESVSYLPKKGWNRGCGCNQTIAARNPNKHCIAGKW